MARRSPNFSASIPKIGWPMPQARFWIAMAIEKSARGQSNSSAMGIWNTPKLARIAKPSIRTMQPEIRTGVKIGDLVMGDPGGLGAGAEPAPANVAASNAIF